MYDVHYLPQLEAFRRHLFGRMPHSPILPFEGIRSLAHVRGRGHGYDGDSSYVPPQGVKYFECREDINGEWVPTDNELPAG